MPTLPGHRPAVLLELDLTEAPADPDTHDPLARLRSRGRRLLRPTLRALHEAGEDPRVVGLLVKVGRTLPWATMQELRIGVRAFAASGKPTVAWAETFGEESGGLSSYVLATAFDEIWLQPGGGLGMLGVGVQTTFLRGALDKLGVEPQLEQRYEYKNAADRVMRSEFTPAHRESLERAGRLDLRRGGDRDRRAGRRMEESQVRELVDTRTANGRRGARGAAGRPARLSRRGLRRVPVAGRTGRRTAVRRSLAAAPAAARCRRAGRATSRWSRCAAASCRAGAVAGRLGAQARQRLGRRRAAGGRPGRPGACGVLRSTPPAARPSPPTRSGARSCRVREAGKPVIVSMGDVAASGGYYIACPADVIVALPATLTGSIGVFGGKFVVRGAAERVGLTTGTSSTARTP